MTRLRRLRRSELPIDCATLARWLIGKHLLHATAEGTAGGRIVETEAYVDGDAAGHAFIGPTARNASLFLRRGHAYVYFIYGMHTCVNVTAETPGVGAGALIRALEPLTGVALMQARRGTLRHTDLARGPGRLAQALGITLADDGHDLVAPGPLWLATGGDAARDVGTSVRIGISREAHRPLRFYERGNPHVSGPPALRR
ncbi:MAG: DNA-3-methyladenine glycosylase [Burkholderiales bacterium]